MSDFVAFVADFIFNPNIKRSSTASSMNGESNIVIVFVVVGANGGGVSIDMKSLRGRNCVVSNTQPQLSRKKLQVLCLQVT